MFVNLEVKYYDKNLAGRDYVVGDIHGNFRRLMMILLKMDFDFKNDRLFSVGDLCDRGPDSSQVTQWMHYPWFIPVLGNHEALIMGHNDGTVTTQILQSVGAQWWFEIGEDNQRKVINYFESLPVAIEVETDNGKVGIIHGNCPDNCWDSFKEGIKTEDAFKYVNKALWTYAKEDEAQIVNGIDYMVIGHTIQKTDLKRENVFLIDTGAAFEGGFFTILDLKTLKAVNHKNMDLV